MLILKNFISEALIKEALDTSEKSLEWESNSNFPTQLKQSMRYGGFEHVPYRLTANLKDYPIAKDFFYETFNNNDFFLEDTVYFSKYVSGSECKEHVDPSNYTVIMLLQNSDLGGYLMLNKEKMQKVVLDVGDAVIFEGKTPHRITEVIKGTRIALTLWLNDIPKKYKIELDKH